MALTALNRTMVALLANNSGASVAQGDVVIVDSASAAAFTTTTTASYASGSVGVVLEPNGIAAGASGIVAFGGYVPKVNLTASATLAQLIKTSTTAKQAALHSAPIVAGDFGQVLGTGSSPAAFLFAQPTAAASGGSTSLAGDSDVLLSSPANNQLIRYDSATSLWKNTSDLLIPGHIAPSGSAPTTSGLATSITAATLVSGSTDTAGAVSCAVSGTGQNALTGLFTLNFASSFATAPFVVLQLGWDGTHALSGTTVLPANPTTSGFQVILATGSFPASSTIRVYYICIG